MSNITTMKYTKHKVNLWSTHLLKKRPKKVPGKYFQEKRVGTLKKFITDPHVISQLCSSSFFFHFSRNDLKARQARCFTRYNSVQTQNKTNRHPYNLLAAAVQPQTNSHSHQTSAAQHANSQDQLPESASQPSASRTLPSARGTQKARGGDRRGRTSRLHAQGDREERLRGLHL